MNSNPSSPEDSKINDAIMAKLNSARWKGRVLAGTALGIGLFTIAVGIVLAWAISIRVMPMERLLIQDYPSAVRQSPTATQNPGAKPGWTKEKLDTTHVFVTAAHGKLLFMISASVVLLGLGTFLVLLLVILNRRATLRQISISLAEISRQMKALQEGR